MSTMYVDKIVEKTSTAGVHIPGHIIQYQQRVFDLNSFSTTSQSFVDYTNVYVDITPKFSNSLIRFRTQTLGKNATSTGYVRFDVVNSNTNARFNPNTYCEAGFYEETGWNTVVIQCVNTANTTSTMRLQLRVVVGSAGTGNFAWSGSDSRHVEAWEIAQ